jgi:Do/DeqQ family serine protease
MRLVPASRILVGLALVLSLAACGKNTKSDNEKAAKPPAATAQTAPKAAAPEAQAGTSPAPTTAPAVNSAAPPTLAPMLKRVSPAVVNISVQATVTAQNPFLNDPFFRRFFNVPEEQLKRKVRAVGSGIIYDAKHGYIITNNHVVAHAQKIVVTLDDRRELTAKLVGTDPQTDVAVLKVDANHLTGIPIGNSDKLEVGDYVVAIGNPFGVGQTATFGIVSALGRSNLGIEGKGGYEDFIQTDASINPGNSGGALLDLNGNLVGINTAILSQSGGNVGIGFAIPINMAKGVIQQLIAHGKVTRGQLGVIVQDLTPTIANAMDLKVNSGALVSQVQPDTGAAAAGIKSGDVITELNGGAIEGASDLRNKIGAMEPGTKVNLTILRKGKTMDISATLKKIKAPTPEAAPKGSPIEGVKLGPIPPSDPSYGKVQGVYITDVQQGSPADAAGLQPGDIIVGADQKPVTSTKELTDIINANKGKPLLLNIKRGDAAVFLVIP